MLVSHNTATFLTYYDIIMVSVLALPVKLIRIPIRADFGSVEVRCLREALGLREPGEPGLNAIGLCTN
jgi:hypothetical protein